MDGSFKKRNIEEILIDELEEYPSSRNDTEYNESPRKHEGRIPSKRKIKIEFIGDKIRRHITFSKRKGGLMKKAHELSTLTGTQVLLLVASETGNVYTYSTPKLQPIIKNPESRKLIQDCLSMTISEPGKSNSSSNTPRKEARISEILNNENNEKRENESTDHFLQKLRSSIGNVEQKEAFYCSDPQSTDDVDFIFKR
eukprot:GHVN01003587.1.p2 GENE.GHVN01003587.1~~GHVN01003587.1.p2  ORF type:complete len:198 (-),score=17.01 GHVN01003587.1:1221-1814(-)